MSNALIAIDLMMTSLNVVVRINEVLQKAKAEGRDVSDEEIAALQAENNALEQELLNK